MSRAGALLLSLALAGSLTACETASRAAAPADARPAAAVGAPSVAAAPRVTVTPADGATSVAPSQRVVVRVDRGAISSVRLTGTRLATKDADGEPVAAVAAPAVQGVLASGGASWTASSGLRFGTRYTATVTLEGSSSPVTTTFTTAKPKKLLTTSISPLTGSTVGVGMPIVVRLSSPVTNRAGVERGLVVTASEPVDGSWSWISDDELHYRPREYWPAKTSVELDVRLAGVDAGGGTTGGKDRTIAFSIGDSMVSTVDVEALRMEVTRNGKVVRTIPVTTGKAGFRTRGGIKVVSEKYRVKTMDAATLDIRPGDREYYRLSVQYAMRVTWSGEFVHGAPWSVRNQGRARVSHGCVGMSLANAKWLFENSAIGDVVEVVNSSRRLESQNGWTDWNVDWDTWRKGSAVHEG